MTASNDTWDGLILTPDLVVYKWLDEAPDGYYILNIFVREP